MIGVSNHLSETHRTFRFHETILSFREPGFRREFNTQRNPLAFPKTNRKEHLTLAKTIDIHLNQKTNMLFVKGLPQKIFGMLYTCHTKIKHLNYVGKVTFVPCICKVW